MIRAPTQKSRLIARTGMGLVACALVLDAWFSPPLPPFSTPIFSLVALGTMQWAKQIRESDGVEIPDSVMRDGKAIAYAEMTTVLACALGVGVVLTARNLGASKAVQQWATAGALCAFLVNVLVVRFTKPRFDALMLAAATRSPGS